MKILDRPSIKKRPMILLIAILILVIFLPAAYYLTTHPFGAKAAWFDDRWGYRQRIDITNTSAALQENYQVFFTIDTSDTTKFTNDCADIRLIDATGTQLPHWIEENNPGCGDAATTIWTKLSVPSSGTFIYIYYGNPSAEDVADDGTNVFELIDDFNDASIDTTKWAPSTAGSGTVIEEAGYIKLDSVAGTGSQAALASVSPITPGFRVRWSSNFVTDRNNQWHLSDVSGHIDQDGIRYLDYVGNANAEYQTTIGGVYATIQEEAKKAVGAHTITLAIATTGFASYTVDTNTYTTTGLTAANIEHLFNYAVGEAAGNSEFWNDWIVITKFVEDGPTAAAPTDEEKSSAPIAYWKLDEGSGTTANDSTGHGFIGSLTNSPTWQTEDVCVSGKCLFFNGTSNNVDMGTPAALDITGPMTVSGWFKVKDPSGSTSQFIASKDFSTGNRGWGMAVVSGKLAFEKGGSNLLTGTTPLQSSTWYHAAVIFDGTTWKLYLNGSEEDSEASTGSLANTDAKFMVGARHYVGVENYFNGFIDDVKVYNYGRSVAQIKTDYNAGKSHAATTNGSSVAYASQESSDALSQGLGAHWKMDEASGNALDSSGNANTATPTGTSIVTGKYGYGRQTTDSNYLSIASSASLSFGQTVTFSAWVYETSYPAVGLGRIVGRSDSSFEFAIDSAASTICDEGILAIYTPQTNWTCTTYTLPLNIWKHLTATFDGSKWRVFVNGALVWTNTVTSSINIAGSIIIGAATGGLEGFPGTIDEVRFYNRSLQPNEVKFLYNFAPRPVGYWKLDDKVSLTEIIDSSGYGHTGAMDGFDNTNWAAGKIGSSLNFDGTDNTVNVTSTVLTSVGPTSTFTFSAWVKPATAQTGDSDRRAAVAIDVPTNQFEAIIGSPYSGDNTLSLEVGKAGVGSQIASSLTTYSLGVWYYVTGVFRNGTADLYVNGVYQSSVTYNATVNSATPGDAILSIGGEKYNGTYDYLYNGQIDEVRVYNYARTPNQIIEDMNAGHPVGGSPIGSQVGHWKLDEGFGTTANDSSPQANTGTIDGATWSNNGKFGKSLAFDGTDDLVDIDTANDDFSQTTGTYSLWINRSFDDDVAEDKYAIAFSVDSNNLVRINYNSTDDVWRFTYIGGATADNIDLAASVIPKNVWTHLALTWDTSADTITAYVNGSQKGTAGTLGTWAGTTANGRIGAFVSSLEFQGLIDEVKLYNAALTPDQIKLDYNRGSTQVLGALSDTSAITGGSVASSSAGAVYCVPGSSSACSSPVAEWKLDEKVSTTAHDTSGNGYDGILGIDGAGTDVPTWVPAKFGSGLRFDGGDGVEQTISDFRISDSQGTITAWVKTSATNGTIFSSAYELGNTIYFYTLVNPSGLLSISTRDITGDVINGDTVISDGAWHHIAVVSDGSAYSLYVDGTPETLTVAAGTNNGNWFADISSRTNWSIGVNQRLAAVGRMNGIIDQVRIFDYPLTQSQITWDYNRGVPIGHWKFDECQGTTANDSSGSQLSGTITIGGGGTQAAVGTCSTPDTAWGNGAIGKFNSSLNFDGTDDFVATADFNAAPSTGFTWSAWIKPADLTDQHDIISFSDGAACEDMEFNTSGTEIYFRIDGTGCGEQFAGDVTTSGANLNTSNWFHITGVRNYTNDTTYVYVNGILLGSATASFTPLNRSMCFNLGRNYDCTSAARYYDGQIDDVRIYNYALTSTQVKDVLNQGSAVRFGPNTGLP